MMDITNNLSVILSGIGITIFLMLSSLICGLLLSLSMIVADYLGPKLLKYSISSIVFFICGTPLLVQIFLIYFGAGQFALIHETFLWFFFKEPMYCAILALSINTACYTFVLIKGAMHSIPKNEVEACLAIGMSKWLALRRIILPRALRIFLPAYSNEAIFILKSTSLVSTITILDLMGVTQELISQTYATVEYYILAGVIYLILTAILTLIFKRLTRLAQVQLV